MNGPPTGSSDLEQRQRLRGLIDFARRQTSGTYATAPGQAGGFSAAESPSEDPAQWPALPGYHVIREIHRGGQGIVFEAIQVSTRRHVAVKVLRDGPLGGLPEFLRFQREVQLLAHVNHPNIVAIHDSGQAAGHFFLVMDYIAGQPLDLYVRDDSVIAARDRASLLQLFATICDAVNAAHLKGVIHRDLKPGNIRVDEAGTPHILDFGLAKRTVVPDADVPDDAAPSAINSMTEAGRFLGSLPWASPEQALGDAARIDVRTDVYSLGVMLYEILTQTFPYRVTGTFSDVVGQITSAAPIRPRLSRRDIDDELETILLKSLQKEPARRYQTAGDLARDIRHYLAGEPIEAKRDSGWYVLRKTMRRYRWQVAVAAAFVVVVTSAAIALSILYSRQRGLLSEVRHERDKALSSERLAQRRFEESEYESYVANIAAAAGALGANDGGAARARLHATPAALRNWEWQHLMRASDESVATLHGPEQLVTGRVTFSPDGNYIAGSFWAELRQGALVVWRSTLGRHSRTAGSTPVQVLRDEGDGPFEFPAHRNQLIRVRDGEALRWNLSDPHAVRRVRLETGDASDKPVVLSRDASFVLALSGRRWDTASGRRMIDQPLLDRPASLLRVERSGHRLLVGHADGTMVVIDAANGRRISYFQSQMHVIYGTAMSPDADRVALSGDETGLVQIWELPSSKNTGDASGAPARLQREFHSGEQRAGMLEFSSDGQLLAVPSADKTIRLWNVADGSLARLLRGHVTTVTCLDFSPDSRFLVSGTHSGEIKVWDLSVPPPMRLLGRAPGPINSVAFSRHGDRLLVNSASLLVMDAANGTNVHELPLPETHVPRTALWGPDDSSATYVDADGSIYSWRCADPHADRVLARHRAQPVLAAAASRDLLISADADAIVSRNQGTGKELLRLPGLGEAPHCLAAAPDGRRVAFGMERGLLHILDAVRRTWQAPIKAHVAAIQSVTFSPDGMQIATASADGTVKLWNAADGAAQWSALPQLGDVWCVAWSPDGTRIVAGGRDRSVRLLDAHNGRELLALRGPTGTVMCVTFSTDGRRIAAGSWAREVFLWDAGHADPLYSPP